MEGRGRTAWNSVCRLTRPEGSFRLMKHEELYPSGSKDSCLFNCFGPKDHVICRAFGLV